VVGCGGETAGAGVVVVPVGECSATGIADGSGRADVGADDLARPGAGTAALAAPRCGAGAAPAGRRPALAGPCRCGATAMTPAATAAVAATAIAAAGRRRSTRPAARSQFPVKASRIRAGTGIGPARCLPG